MKEESIMDWRTCEHKWMKKDDAGSEYLGVGDTAYQYQCSICKIYSYAGKLYDELPDKSKSVFLHGGQGNENSRRLI